MGFRFDEDKMNQALAFLMRATGRAHLSKLTAHKLLYMADREALREGLRRITGDEAYAMEHGPVLSTTYDLMKTPQNWSNPTQEEALWKKHFRLERNGRDIVLLEDPGDDLLSTFERRILEQVAREYGGKSAAELRSLSHTFPEWRAHECGNSSEPIPLRDILEAVGRSPEAAEVLEQEADEEARVARLLGSAPTSRPFYIPRPFRATPFGRGNSAGRLPSGCIGRQDD